MRRSSVLPQFQPLPRRAIEAALEAEQAGLDGVFVYDHLWPLGREPGAPAAECLTLLSALAVETERIRVGTLVLRAGLRQWRTALRSLLAVAEIAPGRVVAGLGTGDRLSAEENRRFGIAYGSVQERLDEVRTLASALAREGLEVWIGGKGRAVRELCAELGLTWNCWGASDDELCRLLDEVPQAYVTWAGDTDPPELTVAVEEVVSTRARLRV